MLLGGFSTRGGAVGRRPRRRRFRAARPRNGRDDVTDRPEQHEEGGYYFADEAPRPRGVPSDEEPSEAPREPAPPTPARDFRRTTPAKLKTIRPERPKGRWGLISGTGLYVMCSAGSADYLPVSVR